MKSWSAALSQAMGQRSARFIGRDAELNELNQISLLPQASMVLCRGRQGVGKSTLIREFSPAIGDYFCFEGSRERDSGDPLAMFGQQLASYLSLPGLGLGSWYEGFELLSRFTAVKGALIFLDELPWRRTLSHERDYLDQLRQAWEQLFMHHGELLLVLSGSDASWLDRNVLNSAEFMRCVCHVLTVNELGLAACDSFWRDLGADVTAVEKFSILAITGGVPRYLEQIDFSNSVGANIIKHCYHRDGVLFSEYQRLFGRTFELQSPLYRELLMALVDSPQSCAALCRQTGTDTATVTTHLEDLETAGFLSLDYPYNPLTGEQGTLCRYRLKDNYLRFYLHCLAPLRNQIESGTIGRGIDFSSLTEIFPVQLQNLILNDLSPLYAALELEPAFVVHAGPYLQAQTTQQGACELALLIDAGYTTFACMFAYGPEIDVDDIDRFHASVQALPVPEEKGVHIVLVHVGELDLDVSQSFHHIISFARLLEIAAAQTTL